jgi:hypothetical protein
MRTVSYPWVEGQLAFAVEATNDGTGEMPFTVLIASAISACS